MLLPWTTSPYIVAAENGVAVLVSFIFRFASSKKHSLLFALCVYMCCFCSKVLFKLPSNGRFRRLPIWMGGVSRSRVCNVIFPSLARNDAALELSCPAQQEGGRPINFIVLQF